MMMRILLCAVLFAVAACGGGAASSPATSTEPTGATEPEAPADPDAPSDPELCCCEIPSVDPIHEMMPSDDCASTGYCVDATACEPAPE